MNSFINFFWIIWDNIDVIYVKEIKLLHLLLFGGYTHTVKHLCIFKDVSAKHISSETIGIALYFNLRSIGANRIFSHVCLHTNYITLHICSDGIKKDPD